MIALPELIISYLFILAKPHGFHLFFLLLETLLTMIFISFSEYAAPYLGNGCIKCTSYLLNDFSYHMCCIAVAFVSSHGVTLASP